MVSSRPLESLSVGGFYANVHGVAVDGREPVHDFLAELGEPDLSAFFARFDKLQEGDFLKRLPWPRMGEWFKSLQHTNNIWQVAAPSHRILGFRNGNTLVLTNGFKKKGGETPKREIKLAEDLMARFKSRS